MKKLPEEIEKRLRTCTSFPTPPAVAMQIVELAQDPEIDLATVASAVSADPAIASKVMRIANSALYARRRQSSNLRQALIVLGLNATLTLALSFSLVNSLKQSPPKGFDFIAYWRRALLAATWGKLLAGEAGRRDAEEIFLSSLLQDIGMLAIDKIAPEVYEGVAPFHLDHLAVSKHEKSVINTDHQAVGAWLLKSWNMPDGLVNGVKNSHDINAKDASPENRGYIRAVAMASELADVWLSKNDKVSIHKAGQLAHKQLGIQPKRMAEMFEIIADQLPVAQGIFEMELFENDQLSDISGMAGEILIVRNLQALSEVSDLQQQKSDLENQNEVLEEESNRDALTGVYNRRGFEKLLAKEFAVTTEHHWPLSVVFVDLDNFKTVNDTHGHPTGDAILKEVADLLVANLRETDIVARYGGDEYVLLLPGVDADQARYASERVVTEIRKRSVTTEAGESVGITLSLGLSTYDSGNSFDSAEDLVAAADTALYHSKRNGRDQHTCFAEIKAA